MQKVFWVGSNRDTHSIHKVAARSSIPQEKLKHFSLKKSFPLQTNHHPAVALGQKEEKAQNYKGAP